MSIQKLRTMSQLNCPNDGTRSVLASIMVPEIIKALKDWTAACPIPCVLIGGIALSFWVKPRYTDDLDFLFLVSDVDLPKALPGFKRTRNHCFEHVETHVEVETLTAFCYGLDTENLIRRVFEEAINEDGVKVANIDGLVALKVQRWSLRDAADVDDLLTAGSMNLSHWPISDAQRELIRQLPNFKESLHKL